MSKVNVTPPSEQGTDKFIENLVNKKPKKKDKILADSIISHLQYKGLSKDQAEQLRNTLQETLQMYEQEEDKKPKPSWDINIEALQEFIQTKRVQNCSNSTLRSYSSEIRRFLESANKPYYEVTSDDIRKYMDDRKLVDRISTRSLHNVRMYLLSFFKWLHVEEKIKKNPMDRIGVVKFDKKVVEYLTDEELEMIRCACTNERDLAIVDILSGSGMRVSELCGLNKSDVDIERGEMRVYGKGSKERICYLTGRAKVHLRWYLESRIDNNPALLVSAKKPYTRLTKSSIEYILKEIGRRSAIPEVRIYPHKFRKTLATQMINRGADIDQVRRLLGHSDSQTTISCYTNISNETTKYEHKKYVN